MGRKRLHEVILQEGEQEELESFIRKGKTSARSQTRARILLLAADGRSDKEIVDVLKVSRGTVRNVRDRYWEKGLDYALNEKPRSGAPPKVDGRVEAELTLLACSDPLRRGDRDGRSDFSEISSSSWALWIRYLI